jgi:hypothetical protein
MNVLQICLEKDINRTAWNLSQAINRASSSKSKHVVKSQGEKENFTDLAFKELGELKPLLDWADVLHFHQWIWTYNPFAKRPQKPKADFFLHPNGGAYGEAGIFTMSLEKKRVVFHFHGGYHQICAQYWIEECKKVRATIFKDNPLAFTDGAIWMPDIPSFFESDNEPDYDGNLIVRILGELDDPTRNNRQIKEMFDLVNTFEKSEIQYFFGEEEDKESAQIVVDNLTQGVADIQAWEALALGQVVFLELADTSRNAYSRIGTTNPFQNIHGIFELGEKILALKNDRNRLRGLGSNNRSWMNKCCTQQSLAKMYLEQYNIVRI